MSQTNSQMKLGLFVFTYGHHMSAWRHPDAEENIAFDFEYFADLAARAEAAKMDILFFADTVAERANQIVTPQTTSFEPTTLLAALAMRTSHIGLVATLSASYNEPYNVARRFASIDQISGGRAGWNLVTTSYLPEAQNFDREEHFLHADRYKRAEEFGSVVRKLWRSWEDDAFLFDKDSGRFFDPAKVHVTNHEGAQFRVRGPLNIARSPQGEPVVFQAGSSGPGKDLAAATAECVFTVQSDFNEARAFYKDLKGRMPAFGRDPADLFILPGVSIFLGDTEAEARAYYDQMLALIPVPEAIAMLQDQLGGVTFEKEDWDRMLPELPPSNAGQTRREGIINLARAENLTVARLAQRHAVTAGHLEIVGTPEQVADRMEEWFRAEACDGFNVKPPVFHRDADAFYAMVLPILQARGLFRREYEAPTLRGRLYPQAPARSLVPA